MKTVRRFTNDLAINQGWNLRDIAYLREQDNPIRGPNTQIFAYSEQEDEENTVQENTIWCKSCNQYTLEYIDALDAYFCTNCANKIEATISISG